MLGFELSPAAATRHPTQTPLAAFFRHGGGTSVAIAEGPDGGLTLWSEVGPGHAACLQLDNNDTATRLSWRETMIIALRKVYPVGALTLTGSWSRLQSSGSGLAGSFTGNRAVSTSAPSAVASVTVDRAEPYDVWVHYTARTNGGYVKVEIDGAQTLVTGIADPANLGFKAFPTYSATDMQRRRTIQVASGLTGVHEISLSLGGTANPGGNAILLEAVSISGTLSDPYVMPPVWQPSTPYEMGDEVQLGGVFYSARGDGNSGVDGPSHITGIASDGALDWRADNRPTYPEFVTIDYASEREFAARFATAGIATEVGGQTHGNEALTARVITVDGVAWTPADGFVVGQEIAITEQTLWRTQSGLDVATCQLHRRVEAGTIRHDVTLTGLGPQVDMEWFYAGMLPMVRWDGEQKANVVDRVWAPTGGPVVLDDFSGVSPPNVGFPGVSRPGLSGTALMTPFLYGHEAGALPIAGNQIGALEAFLRPNLDARIAGGNLDWGAKAYVALVSPEAVSFGDGDVVGFFNRHVISVG